MSSDSETSGTTSSSGALSVATNRPKKTDEGWTEDTDWHRIKVFGGIAERCQRIARKGALVAVEGSMSYERYEREDGTVVRSACVLADRLEVLVFAPRERDSEVEGTSAPTSVSAEA